MVVCGKPSRAETTPRLVQVAIEWTRSPGAEECISTDELLSRTRARAPSDIRLTLDRVDADFLIVGRVESDAGSFRTALELRDAGGRSLGKRTFVSMARSCSEIEPALIFALVLLVETPLVREAKHERPTEELIELAPPLLSPAPGVPIAPLRLTQRSTERRPPWTVDVGLGLSAAVGLAPRPTIGPDLSLMVRPPSFVPVVLRGAGYPFGVDRPTVEGEGITVRGFVGGLELCPLDRAGGVIDVRACGGAHLAFLHAAPRGPLSRRADLPFLVLPLRAELRARTGPVMPYLAITGRFAPSPPSLLYRAPGRELRTSYEVPWAMLELDLGVQWSVLP